MATTSPTTRSDDGTRTVVATTLIAWGLVAFLGIIAAAVCLALTIPVMAIRTVRQRGV